MTLPPSRLVPGHLSSSAGWRKPIGDALCVRVTCGHFKGGGRQFLHFCRGNSDTTGNFAAQPPIPLTLATRLPQSATYCSPSRRATHWTSISVTAGCVTASSNFLRGACPDRERRRARRLRERTVLPWSGLRHIRRRRWRTVTRGVWPPGWPANKKVMTKCRDPIQ